MLLDTSDGINSPRWTSDGRLMKDGQKLREKRYGDRISEGRRWEMQEE